MHKESLEHAALIGAARCAETVAADGAQPNEQLLQRLSDLSTELRKARRAVNRGLDNVNMAQECIDDAENDNDEKGDQTNVLLPAG